MFLRARSVLEKGVCSACPVLGFLLVTEALKSRVFAAVSVPEIDPGSATSALTLLFGGLLLLVHRRRQ